MNIYFTVPVLALAVLTIGFTKRLRRIQWDYCPQTIATVQTAQVLPVFGNKKSFDAVICYAYSVDGQWFDGLYRRGFQTEEAAACFVAECQPRKLTAAYKPESPHESRLFVQPTAFEPARAFSTELSVLENVHALPIDLQEAFICCDCEAICNSAIRCSRCQSEAVISVARLIPHYRDAIRIILSADRQDTLPA